MIKFSNWNISAIGQALGRQYDNLTRSIDVIGDFPDGWAWAVLLEFGDNLNIISLTPGEIGLHADLTADMLAFRGDYRLQLRGTDGVKVRHTNIITVAVSESISGDAKWPEIPAEFTQLEQRVQQSAQQAAQSAESAQNAQQAIENMTASADTLPPGEPATVTKTNQGGVVNLAFGIPAGAPGKNGDPGKNGNDGFSPIVTVEQTADGATITAIDKNGTTSATVKNGENGDPGTNGVDGGYYAPSVSEDGELNWTASKPSMPEIPSTNIKGPAGQDAPQINDDTVSTTNPWSSRKIVDTLAPTFEASGPVVTCTPVEGYPLHVVSQIVPVQSGSGDPSPDNVRPISGWDAANLWVGGKNLFDELEFALASPSYYQFVDSSLEVKNRDGRAWTSVPVALTLPAGRYYISCSNGAIADVRNADVSKIYVLNKTSSFFVLEETTQIKVKLFEGNDGTSFNVVLAVSDSEVSYSPYNPASKTITLPFGQVVYGGTLDWNAGVLTVTHAEIASYAGEPLPGAWISDRDAYSQGATPTTGAQVVYELSEPQTIQLTPAEILVLSSTNTIYTDTGDTTVSGRADPNAIIQQLAARIAALEGAATNL